MSNMSYCRFQNTQSDLVDCEAHICDKLERDEANARLRMLNTAKSMLEACGVEVGQIPSEEDMEKGWRELRDE